MKEDTIAAVATPAGFGAISIIRVSGPDTFRVADLIFEGKRKISESESHTIHYGRLVNALGDTMDDVLISVFKAPNSYTGEDSVEINIHGSPFIAKLALELLVEKGAKLAEPGEFTKRAFINRRIDLSQAEAVVDIIRSSTDASLRGARNQLNGILSQKVLELRSLLINLSSFVELELDFSEEDIQFIGKKKLNVRIDEIIKEIDILLSTYSFGRVIRDGINVVIVGQPNVGKSSLLNYILKESRAIVSHIPGTTRDIIREEVSMDGILIRLYDTAGIRFSEDEIEKEGVTRSREAVKNADIVVFLGDIERGFSEEIFKEICGLNSSGKIFKVMNKVDLDRNTEINAEIKISAKTGLGIDELLKKIKDTALGSSSFTEKTAIISSLRHYNCLEEARKNLLNAKNAISQEMSGEFISVDLRNAEQSLAEIIGVVTSDDILNNVFSKFCIGK